MWNKGEHLNAKKRTQKRLLQEHWLETSFDADLCFSLVLNSLNSWLCWRGREPRWRLPCVSYRTGSAPTSAFFLRLLEEEYNSSSTLWMKRKGLVGGAESPPHQPAVWVCSPQLALQRCEPAEKPTPASHCCHFWEERSDNLSIEHPIRSIRNGTHKTFADTCRKLQTDIYIADFDCYWNDRDSVLGHLH